MRLKARVDGNQKKLVEHLRRCGFSVHVCSALGGGFPDLVVGYKGVNYLFEVKDPDKAPSQRKLTPEEEKFKQGWRGSYYVILNIEEALKIINK